MKTTTPDREAVRRHAKSLGFDAVRFARAATPSKTREDFRAFLAAGLHGDMAWLESNAARRADPQVLWPDAKSVIVLGANYGPEDDPMGTLRDNGKGTISVYARNRDYHDILKKRLKQLAGWLNSESGAEVKVFVDTAPVLEKPLAQQAGLGWQGKHTNLVSREFGSWLFLGEVFTALEFEPDEGEADHCGQCRQCLDVCPTNAFIGPHQIDARKCISYLTIEHKGPIPRNLRPLMGNRIYGCDDCLAVCPWNKFAGPTEIEGFKPRRELSGPALKELARLDDAQFRAKFSGSPIKRIGRTRFLRNVLNAIGNSADRNLLPDAERLLSDESPLVRGAAVWAVLKLASVDHAAHLRAAHLPKECDEDVQKEWAAED